MTLRKKKKQYYGDNHADIAEHLREYTADSYRAEHFANAVCKKCKAKAFMVQIDDNAGVCVRTCASCKKAHPVGDSAEYMDEAELDECQCPCGSEVFEITVGVSLYAESEDVRWIYIGLRCTDCGLIGNYGDWKNEYENYKKLLALV